MATDNATLVSMLPWNIQERRPGLLPGEFFLPAAKDDDFEILHVPVCISRAYVDEDRGFIESKEFADDIAESIVYDLVKSFLQVDEVSKPAFGWLPGKLTKEEIKTKHKNFLEELKKQQLNWFRRLVELADDDYQKTHMHQVVSDLQRKAAKVLGLKRDWSIVVDNVAQSCIACKSALALGSIKCPFCQTVQDAKAYAALTQAS